MPIVVRLACGLILSVGLVVATTVATSADEPISAKPLASIADLERLLTRNNISIDLKRRVVSIEGEVCIGKDDRFRENIEVLACVHESKEYEALLSCKTSETALTAALLVIGAARPTKSKAGSTVGITLHWKEDGKQKLIPAQDWIVIPAAAKPYRGVWRFNEKGGGSGELINTSNGSGVLNLHPSPTINTAIPATFPPKGTKVRIELTILRKPVG